jgi:hypothetical protein
MLINRLFRSNYLRANDLEDDMTTMTIDRVEIDSFQDGEKPVLYFTGEDRGLVMNRTNAKVVSDAYGPETDSWTGRPLMLFSSPVEFQGKTVDSIRVKIPKAPPRLVRSEPRADDDIPF